MLRNASLKEEDLVPAIARGSKYAAQRLNLVNRHVAK
jgi:hypothetical protein